MLWSWVKWKAFLSLPSVSHLFSQTIVSFSAKWPQRNVMPYSRFWMCMRNNEANNWNVPRPPCSSVLIWQKVLKQHEKYLGLPSFIGRNNKKSFREIKEKLAGKLARWKEKLLSKVGKEVLIKAVAQAIPTYAMSCFKIPDTLCDEITTLIKNFWWDSVKRSARRLGSVWKNYVRLRPVEVWASSNLDNSTWHC